MNRYLGVLISLCYQFDFHFLLKGIGLSCIFFCLSGFCCVLFLIHDEYGIGLKAEFPNRSTSKWQSESNGYQCKLFICAWSTSVFTAYLHSNLGDVSSFVRSFFYFVVFLLLFFLLIIQVVGFYWVCLLMQDSFLLSKLYVGFGSFTKII